MCGFFILIDPAPEQVGCSITLNLFFLRIVDLSGKAGHPVLDIRKKKSSSGFLFFITPGKDTFHFSGLVHTPEPAFQYRNDDPHATFHLL
jgi:hypothetical protein